MISSLDYFKEESRPVFQRFCEELKEVAFLVVIYKNLMLLKNINILLDFKAGVCNACPQIVVVCVGYFVKECNSTIFHSCYCFDYVLRTHGNVLNSSSTIIVTILLNLTLSLTISRFVDRHLDLFIEIRHHDRA